MMELRDRQVLYTVPLRWLERDGLWFGLDNDGPNWIATEERGYSLLLAIDGSRTLGELTRLYAQRYGLDGTKAWLHVHDLIREAMRHHILFSEPLSRPPYRGRGAHC